MILFIRCADSDVAVCRAAISGCSEPNPVERDLDSCRFSPLPDKSGKDLGALPQTLLRKLLGRSFLRTFKNFTQGGFHPYVYVALVFVAIYALRIPAAPAPNPVQRDWQGGYRRSLRYRIEKVQVSC